MFMKEHEIFHEKCERCSCFSTILASNHQICAIIPSIRLSYLALERV